MKKTSYFLKLMLFLVCVQTIQSQQIITFNSIPNRNSSDHYLCRVKFANELDTEYRNANVLQTRAKEVSEDPEAAYYGVVRGFTASWMSFESDFSSNIVVEISKKNGTAITKAMVRPVGEAQSATILNGKAYVTFTKPANINVDINGQMEDNYTGYGYNGAKVHTISLFANPIFEVPTGSDVKVVQPGEDYANIDRSLYPKLVFAPGVHDLGMQFPINSNEVLYIPGDAIIHGTIHPPNLWGNAAAKNFKVYGSGTISGENIIRDPTNPAQKTPNGREFKPFTYQAEGAHLEGFVVIDPAYHTFNMGHTGDANNINIYKNLKILAWRRNSDGINAFNNSEVSNCFFRVQDDAFYYGAENVNQHNNTVWNDANGAVIFLQNIVDGSSSNFSDVKVIYHRSHWHWWDGGRIVSMRDFFDNNTISNVTIKNITVEDPLPAFPPFYANIDGPNGTNMTFNNIVFENIHQEHNGVVTTLPGNRTKPQNTLKGISNQLWENITFKNCYFNGKTLTNFTDGDFFTEFVDTNTVIFSSDKLVNFTAPEIVYSNSTATTSVEYFTTESRDLQVSLQRNSAPWTNYGFKRINIPAGSGIVDMSFDVATDVSPDINPGLEYKLTAVLLPVNGNWLDRIDQITHNNIIGENPEDELINFVSPDQVYRNQVVTTTVEYSASEDKDILVFIQQNSSPWQGHGLTRVTVPRGIQSVNINLTVSDSIPYLDNSYKIVASLVPVGLGWNSQYQIVNNNVDAIDNSPQPKGFNSVDDILIYPNPTSKTLYIKSDTSIKHLKIQNLSGSMLLDKKVTSNKKISKKGHILDVSSYAKGIYILQIIDNNQKTTLQKLIIQ